MKDFTKLSTGNFEKLWTHYQEYKTRVIKLGPNRLTLRDKDRYLYGKSNALQLENDIRISFNVSVK